MKIVSHLYNTVYHIHHYIYIMIYSYHSVYIIYIYIHIYTYHYNSLYIYTHCNRYHNIHYIIYNHVIVIECRLYSGHIQHIYKKRHRCRHVFDIVPAQCKPLWPGCVALESRSLRAGWLI